MTDGYDFKVGDSVRAEGSSHSSTVVRVDDYGCVVQGKSGRRLWVPKGKLHLQCDRKTAFLTELQALLRKYDARIYDHDDYKLYVEIDHHRDKNVGFDNLFRIEYSDTNGEINADNVMDFDKE